MRARDFIFERETVPFQGIDISVEREEDEILVRASAGGRPLGSVLFVDYDGELMPQDLEVDERYRGQGIARTMYDYVKSLGYKIRRSGQQTDAGAGFWARHRPDSNVWEQGVAEGQFDSLIKSDQAERNAYKKFVADRAGGDWSRGARLYAKLKNRPADDIFGDDARLQQFMRIKFDFANFTKQDWRDFWLLSQHADKYPGFQKQALDAIEKHLGQGNDYYRYLADRISCARTGQQKYGTQDICDQQGVAEVKILSRVKGKGSEPGQLPRFGRPIAPGDETRYLGTKVADWQGREIWRDYLGGQLSYHLFDPDTRTVIVTTFGSRYKMNPRSYIIHGLYAAPGNPVRAAEFYRGLVRDLGLTLISDRKQSPGGNRVWQQLEQFPDVEVYGYDTNTDQALNFGAGDVEMYTVPSAAVAGSKEMQRVARDLRLVATAR